MHQGEAPAVLLASPQAGGQGAASVSVAAVPAYPRDNLARGQRGPSVLEGVGHLAQADCGESGGNPSGVGGRWF